MYLTKDENIILGQCLHPVQEQIYKKKPHCAIGSLIAFNGKNVKAVGTGIQISPDLVLTVKHNVYDYSNGR